MDVSSEGFIPAAAALLGAAISGFFTYQAARIGFNAKRQRQRLLRLLLDLEYFLALEHAYIERLVERDETPLHTVKVAMRNVVKESLGRAPSRATEPARLREMIATLQGGVAG